MAPVELTHPSLYINRELSQLEFNRRVLEQAMDPRVPLLERLRFTTIVSTNLDEFFEIRVASIKEQVGFGLPQPGHDVPHPAGRLRAPAATLRSSSCASSTCVCSSNCCPRSRPRASACSSSTPGPREQSAWLEDYF